MAHDQTEIIQTRGYFEAKILFAFYVLLQFNYIGNVKAENCGGRDVSINLTVVLKKSSYYPPPPKLITEPVWKAPRLNTIYPREAAPG